MRKLLSAFMLLYSALLLGQVQGVSGLVVDESGVPLPGATIIVKGTNVGGITDFDGNFTIKVSEPVDSKILLVSYLGYKDQAVSLLKKRKLKITMLQDNEALDEVVVIGFGTVKKSDLTGAVASVKGEEISKVGTISLDQALAGKASGVMVTQTSGVPGAGASIRIRGITSTNGTEPLYVVDGIPIDNTPIDALNDQAQAGASMSPLSTINPSDIESVEILKDASATAIYGSRGANGVILITTKTGKLGKGIVQVSSETGLAHVRKYYDVQDANEYWLTRYEAYKNDGTSNVRETLLDSARLGLLPTTDWQDAIFRVGKTTNHNISVRGGNEGVKYSFSTNLSNIEGVLKGTDFNRVASRLNVDANVNDKLSIGGNINFTNVTSNQKSTSTNTEQAYGTNSIISRALLTSPAASIFEEFEYGDESGNGQLDSYSPLEALESNLYNNIINQFRGSVTLKYSLSKNMYFKSNVSYYTRYTGQTFYQLTDLSTRSGILDGRNGWARTQDSRSSGIVNQNTFNYNFNLGKKHKFTTMIGQSINTQESFSVRTSNFGFANDILTIYDPGSATFQDDDDVRASESNLLSFFGRLNYKYNNKWLFTLTARADASSKFAENNKWGFFPAAAMAYNLHKENFMKDSDAISNLKLRLSYGFSGNQSVSPYQSLSILGTNQHVFGDGSGGEAASTIVYPLQLPNSDLKWEYTEQLDFGVDFGLFSNKITGTVEYYNKVTRDLLFRGIAIPSHSGFTSFTKNYGAIQTQGYEFSINAHIISKPKFSWTLGGNIGFGKTKIKDLAEDYVRSGLSFGIVTDTQRLIVGDEFGAFFGLKTAGIAQFDDFVEFQGLTKQQQVDMYNADPTANYTLVDGIKGKAPSNTTQLNPGAQLYEDLNEDGVINADDNQVIGRAQADATFGINNSFSFGNIDLSFFIDGQVGNDIANMMSLRTLAFGGNQQSSVVKEAWTPESPSTIYPRLDSSNNSDYNFSDRFIEDGSFIRLQNITLGYNFRKEAIRDLGISNLKIYAAASNLIVLTNYSGFNPDVSLSGTNIQSIGHDNAAYPVPALVRLGLNVQF